jgi:hypothetical protein
MNICCSSLALPSSAAFDISSAILSDFSAATSALSFAIASSELLLHAAWSFNFVRVSLSASCHARPSIDAAHWLAAPITTRTHT